MPGCCLLLQRLLALAAVLWAWGAQVLPFLRPDGVEGDLRGEEVFYGSFPAPGLTLEEKESNEAAGHHEGEQEEEDQGREVGGEVVAFQMDHGGCRPSELRHQSAASSLGKTKQGSVGSLGDVRVQVTTQLMMTVQAHLALLCFTLLHFAAIAFFVRVDKLKVCVNPTSSKSTGAIFPTAFVHFVSLGHILVILEIFQTLH